MRITIDIQGPCGSGKTRVANKIFDSLEEENEYNIYHFDDGLFTQQVTHRDYKTDIEIQTMEANNE